MYLPLHVHLKLRVETCLLIGVGSVRFVTAFRVDVYFAKHSLILLMLSKNNKRMHCSAGTLSCRIVPSDWVREITTDITFTTQLRASSRDLAGITSSPSGLVRDVSVGWAVRRMPPHDATASNSIDVTVDAWATLLTTTFFYYYDWLRKQFGSEAGSSYVIHGAQAPETSIRWLFELDLLVSVLREIFSSYSKRI